MNNCDQPREKGAPEYGDSILRPILKSYLKLSRNVPFCSIWNANGTLFTSKIGTISPIWSKLDFRILAYKTE